MAKKLHGPSQKEFSMFSSFSNFNREILSQARKEALLLKHDFIGSEHILLALCRFPDSPAGEIFSNLVNSPNPLKRISEEVESLMPLYKVMPGDGRDEGEVVPFSPEGKNTLERSAEIAIEEGRSEIGPEHLLLSILRGPSSIAKIALEHLGVTWEKVEIRRQHPEIKPAYHSSPARMGCSAGRRISEYILVEKIGEGGFGEVWKAKHHIFSEQLAAIKILKDRGRKNLEKEGLIQNKLYHLLKNKGLEFGMVELKGFDPYGEPPYLIMEYVEGLSLRKYLQKKKRLPLSSVISVFEKILDVLEVAHSYGLVHGDLKPENILVAPLEEIKLVDFGVARSLEKGFLEKGSREKENLHPSLGSSSALAMEGTLQYMAPEQKQAQPPTPRSDIYSLGILLYEMLLGELPQGGETPRTFLPHLPEFIDDVYKQCYTHKNLRFADGRALKKQWILEKRIWELKEQVLQKGERVQEPCSYPLPKDLILPDQAFVCPQCGQRISAENTFMFCIPQDRFTCSGCGYRAPLEDFFPSGMPSYATTLLKQPGQRERIPLKKPSPNLAKGQKSPEGKRQEGGASRPAGLAIRGLAFCIDGIVLMLLFPFFLFSLFSALETVPSLSAVMALSWVFCSLYFILLTSAFGGTIGKLSLGLKVVDKDGKKLHLGDSIIRFIGYFFSLFLFGFGFYIIFFHPQKRGLHDYFGYSWVIRE